MSTPSGALSRTACSWRSSTVISMFSYVRRRSVDFPPLVSTAEQQKGDAMRLSWFSRSAAALLIAALGAIAPRAAASSHREALAILNEPCADNTDTFAWVNDATHDKLYIIMDYNPLHEPGHGNQGFRAC